jgi:hypothetical protein
MLKITIWPTLLSGVVGLLSAGLRQPFKIGH